MSSPLIRLLFRLSYQAKRAKSTVSKPSSATNGRSARKRAAEFSSSSSDDEPLAVSPRKPQQVIALAIPPPSNGEVVSADVPLAGDAAEAAANLQKAAPQTSGEALSEGHSSDDDAPLLAKTVGRKRAPPKEEEDQDSDDAPLAKKAPPKKKAVKRKVKVRAPQHVHRPSLNVFLEGELRR